MVFPHMEWVLLILLASFLAAILSETNRVAQLNATSLNLWQKIFSALILLPVLFLTWPSSSAFYLVAIFNGLIITLSGIITFSLAAKHNGRVAVMFMPVKIFVAFAFWLMINPALIEAYTQHAGHALAVLASIILGLCALFFMRRNDIGWATFCIVLPIGFLYGIADVLVKLELGHNAYISLLQESVIFAFVAIATSVVFSLLWSWKEKKLFIKPDKKLLKTAFTLAVIANLAFTAILAGLSLSPNPAYVSALMLMTPVWLMGYHKISRIPDNSAPLAGFLLVVSVIGIVIAAAGIRG